MYVPSTLDFEMRLMRWFIGISVVYQRLPILEADEHLRIVERKRLRENKRLSDAASPRTISQRLAVRVGQVGPALRQAASDWREFIASPVFPSSLAISLLYLSVLSYVPFPIPIFPTEIPHPGSTAQCSPTSSPTPTPTRS